MTQNVVGDLFQVGPFEVTGEHFVIARSTGPTFGNTVARCYPLSQGGYKIPAARVAELLAELLNAEVERLRKLG